jgi:amino acid permease
MPKKPDYKKTEKWWLGLIVLFYVLYNLPGVPKYGDPHAAILHGVLTVLPIWIVCYAGLIILNKQRRLKEVDAETLQKMKDSEEGDV